VTGAGTGVVASGATGQQCHRLVQPSDRHIGQAARALARSRTQSPRLAIIGNVGNRFTVLELDEVHAAAWCSTAPEPDAHHLETFPYAPFPAPSFSIERDQPSVWRGLGTENPRLNRGLARFRLIRVTPGGDEVLAGGGKVPLSRKTICAAALYAWRHRTTRDDLPNDVEAVDAKVRLNGMLIGLPSRPKTARKVDRPKTGLLCWADISIELIADHESVYRAAEESKCTRVNAPPLPGFDKAVERPSSHARAVRMIRSRLPSVITNTMMPASCNANSPSRTPWRNCGNS
jgi:hypothetical protein